MNITKPVVPSESDNLSRTELADTAQRYALEVQETYQQSRIADIKLTRVDWEVSPQLCRAGAYCETLLDDPPEHTIVLSYPGYRSWGWDRMKDIIRHELGHVVINEEYEDGVTAHGPEFQSVAESVDAPLRGEDPVPYRYQLYCSYCGAMVDGFYKASDRTQNPDKYQSPCCDTSLTVEINSDWPGYATE